MATTVETIQVGATIDGSVVVVFRFTDGRPPLTTVFTQRACRDFLHRLEDAYYLARRQHEAPDVPQDAVRLQEQLHIRMTDDGDTA